MRNQVCGSGWRIQISWLVLVLTLGLALLNCEAKEYNATSDEENKAIYIVVFEDMPIVIYNGHLPGLRGTAKYFSQRWRKAHKRYLFFQHLVWCFYIKIT